ncbi:MAG: hypothetical protein C0511_09550 [Hyphomicrobium sp.]|nr:hypothetical protein [Hyphomicrobium sp.]PPC81843.1 MAG: peptidase M24 [Hyphomicrobium sp.]
MARALMVRLLGVGLGVLFGPSLLWGEPQLPAADAPSLSLPVACVPGRTCFVQNHVDIDPGSGVRDYACAAASYDGHKGVDFRLGSVAAAQSGVAVLAAAPGVVKGVRDGVEDALMRETGPGAIVGRECGNGVVLDHGGGWETQYCHLRRGSVSVARGQPVARGARLGDVGYSGFADFAHLHFEVRRDGKPVEPFSQAGAGMACLRDPATAVGLWDEAAAKVLTYVAGEFIETGFAAAIPSTLDLEHGGNRIATANPMGDGLVFYARLMNGRAGDHIRVVVSGPGGFAAEGSSAPLERPKAIAVYAAGRKRRGTAFASGLYTGVAELVRDGAVMTRARGSFEMP